MSTAKAANSVEVTTPEEESVIEGTREISDAELKAIIESLIFVADEPINVKMIADVVDVDRDKVDVAIQALAQEYEARPGGLQLRVTARRCSDAMVAELHEHIREHLKSEPSAKLSRASLESLALIGYRLPVTIPEILELRGLPSPS